MRIDYDNENSKVVLDGSGTIMYTKNDHGISFTNLKDNNGEVKVEIRNFQIISKRTKGLKKKVQNLWVLWKFMS